MPKTWEDYIPRTRIVNQKSKRKVAKAVHNFERRARRVARRRK